MTPLSEDQIKGDLDKFLFLFPLDKDQLASRCCYFFTLKQANLFLSYFGILGSFFGIYLGITSNVPLLKFVYCGLDIISLICCIMVLLAVLRRNVVLAYYGYAISAAKTILYFVVYFLYLFVYRIGMGNTSLEEDPDKSDDKLNSKIFEALIKVPISVYFLWINFSFAKHLQFKNFDLIEGN